MRRIEYFLYPDVTGLDVVGPLDVFTAATEIVKQKGKDREGYEAVFFFF